MTSTSSGLDADLRAGFAGEILTPDDGDRYDAARTGFNAMFDRRPALIAQATSSADVAAALGFARARACRSPCAVADTRSPASRPSTTASSSTSGR